MIGILAVGIFTSRTSLSDQETYPLPAEEPQDHTSDESIFGAFQTYEIFFSLHPQEIDRLSNIRILGMNILGGKTFLHFQTMLNNQMEQGFLDLDIVTAIFPSNRQLVSMSEVMVDRQPVNQEKVKEVRSETVREILRETPPSNDKH